jgi:hypothetical protein
VHGLNVREKDLQGVKIALFEPSRALQAGKKQVQKISPRY